MIRRKKTAGKGIRKNELIGGLTTFLTICYVTAVNPVILNANGEGIPISGALTATVLLTSLVTLIMGLYADLPFAVAPGMGINAFFAYQLVLTQHVPWQTGLGITFWAGVIFLILSVLPVREKIAAAIPPSIRSATAIGIGLFLAFIGLKNGRIIGADPATLIHLNPISFESALVWLGLVMIFILHYKRNALAFLFPIVTITVLEAFRHKTSLPEKLFSLPDFSSAFLKTDFLGSLDLSLAPSIAAIFLTDLFDSISTLVGVSRATGLVDENGTPKNFKKGLIVDSLATLFAGLFGTSAGTAYIESAAGIEAGARTGQASVVTALLFLPLLFVAPLVGLIPIYATAPVLIFVGLLMCQEIKTLANCDWPNLFPALLVIVLIPLTFSITHGVLIGVVAATAVQGFRKGIRSVPTAQVILAVLCLALIAIEMSR